ncbi:conserved Plasmodium protein, unknown function [Plasmodium relictum]|uniref:Uncharacterized protein n=1 Tax=Plasmodium relictum TaxID=85471 RepID=A0A1J1H3D3_PLARL|nr:conserved Plasmodium protein, unknown function [Plasmodium relictum]CRG99397.1 conserved Plasmodium protein, unknown function [Plasmodium relictum]
MKNEDISERETLLKYKLNNSNKKRNKDWKEKVASIIKTGNKNDASQHDVSSPINTESTSIFNFRKFKFFTKSKNICKVKSNNSKEFSIFSNGAKENMEKFSLKEQSSNDDKLSIDKCSKDNISKQSTIKISKNDIKELKKSKSSINTKVDINHSDNNKKNSKYLTKGNYSHANSYNKSVKAPSVKIFEKNKIVSLYRDPNKNINLTENKTLIKNIIKTEPKNFSKKFVNNNNLNEKKSTNFNKNKNEDFDDEKLKFSSKITVNDNKLHGNKAYLNNNTNENFLLSNKNNTSMELRKKYSNNILDRNLKINKTYNDNSNIKNSNSINNLKLKKNDLVKRADIIIKKQIITTDELLNADNLKSLHRMNTKELMNMEIPFKLDPPNLFCENAYNISPLTPIEEKIDMVHSILNNHKNEIITLLNSCIDNNKQCSEMLKIVLDALIEGENSIASKLNKNKSLQNEIVTELEQILTSVNQN